VKITICRLVMKYKLYGAILVALVSATASLVLRTHVRIPPANIAAGGNVKGDSTRSRPSVTNRSHLPGLAKTSRASRTKLLETYGKLPLSFEANNGQTDSQVDFLARGSGYTLFLTSLEAVLALHGGESRPRNTSLSQESQKSSEHIIRFRALQLSN
jgi:hypothetical protein